MAAIGDVLQGGFYLSNSPLLYNQGYSALSVVSQHFEIFILSYGSRIIQYSCRFYLDTLLCPADLYVVATILF